MKLICSRIHFYEINDQPWFPQYLREMVQSCLTVCWTFRAPVLQKASPAQAVASIIYQTLSDGVVDYTYVDFCAGAGGPTPFIEKYLNMQLSNVPSLTQISNPKAQDATRQSTQSVTSGRRGSVKFVLTDLHPHIANWTEASKRSDNLSFVSEPVDAGNAPACLNGKDGKKIFRLYNLAFHHFDDDLAKAILRNTIETADGFGFVTVLNTLCRAHAYQTQYIRTTGENHCLLHNRIRYGGFNAPHHPILFLEVAKPSLFHLHHSNRTLCHGI